LRTSAEGVAIFAAAASVVGTKAKASEAVEEVAALVAAVAWTAAVERLPVAVVVKADTITKAAKAATFAVDGLAAAVAVAAIEVPDGTPAVLDLPRGCHQ
jgi:hypothetical protein